MTLKAIFNSLAPSVDMTERYLDRINKGRMCLNLKALSFVLMLGLGGCAGTGVDKGSAASRADTETVVAKMAKARWDALIRGNLADAYGYMSPGARAVMSLEMYQQKVRTGLWKKAVVDSVTCDDDRCKVALEIEFHYRDVPSVETRIEENWLREGDKWWYVPKR